ncbi:MAG: hypothetical protein ACRCXM_12570, partial [Beijerinckiaceae bacterium]
ELHRWQGKLAYLTPDKLAEELNRPNDGLTGEQRQRAVDAADKESAKIKTDEIVNSFQSWGGLVFRGAMGTDNPGMPTADVQDQLRADFEMLYREKYLISRDAATAKKQAMEELRTVWSVSGTNGGRLMKHAPEAHYKPINGSHDWMKAQLDNFIRNDFVQTVAPTVTSRLTGTQYGPPSSVQSYQLVTDPRVTQSDISQGKLPRYRLIYTDSLGRIHLAQDANGQPLYWRFDDTAELEKNRARAEAARANRRTATTPLFGAVR